MKRVAVVEAVRTPFCKMGTLFDDLSAQELGRIAAREVVERSEIDPYLIDEVIFGCVGQPADAANIARVISLMAGIPFKVPAFTVHRNCASGIEAADQAMIKITAGYGHCYLVGGAESMSNIPFYYTKKLQNIFSELGRAKTLTDKIKIFSKLRLKELLSPRIGLQMGLTDPVCGLIMGLTAEVLAKEFDISRKEQDEFALISHQRAIKAKDQLREEIVPVIPQPKYKKIILDDNGPRDGQSIDALAKLKPYFDRKAGTVTVGNSSQVTDGAAAMLIVSEDFVKKHKLNPLGYIKATAFAGVEPHRMGIGPAHAIPQVLKKAGMKLNDIQALEINEAFAAQVIACVRALGSDKFAEKFGYTGFTGKIDPEKLNVYGGAIALGHPVGTTGARLILSMLKQLKRNNMKNGLISLCVGGGQGAAVLLESN